MRPSTYAPGSGGAPASLSAAETRCSASLTGDRNGRICSHDATASASGRGPARALGRSASQDVLASQRPSTSQPAAHAWASSASCSAGGSVLLGDVLASAL